jgi:hypothetical protein
MNKKIAILLTLMMLTNGYAQETQKLSEKIIQTQLLTEKESFYLVENQSNKGGDSSTIKAFELNIELKYTADGGKSFTYCQLDSVKKTLSTGYNISAISISFIDRSVGFIYGYASAYTYYPFLFRTEDGGKTWQTIFANTIDVPLRRGDFYMFNEKKGILILNWNSQPNFNYMITEDRGKSWQQKSYTISRDDIRILNEDSMLTTHYSPSGLVMIRFNNHDPKATNKLKSLIIQSTDFGQTFVEL